MCRPWVVGFCFPPIFSRLESKELALCSATIDSNRRRLYPSPLFPARRKHLLYRAWCCILCGWLLKVLYVFGEVSYVLESKSPLVVLFIFYFFSRGGEFVGVSCGLIRLRSMLAAVHVARRGAMFPRFLFSNRRTSWRYLKESLN